MTKKKLDDISKDVKLSTEGKMAVLEYEKLCCFFALGRIDTSLEEIVDRNSDLGLEFALIRSLSSGKIVLESFYLHPPIHTKIVSYNSRGSGLSSYGLGKKEVRAHLDKMISLSEFIPSNYSNKNLHHFNRRFFYIANGYKMIKSISQSSGCQLSDVFGYFVYRAFLQFRKGIRSHKAAKMSQEAYDLPYISDFLN